MIIIKIKCNLKDDFKVVYIINLNLISRDLIDHFFFAIIKMTDESKDHLQVLDRTTFRSSSTLLLYGIRSLNLFKKNQLQLTSLNI